MRRRHGFTAMRFVVGTLIGLVAGVVGGLTAGWIAAPAVFWLVAASVWLVMTWVGVWSLDAGETARWSTREDPTIGVTHLVLLLASVASLGGVGLLLGASGDAARVPAGLVGLASVAASWAMVHTLFALRYAALYYRGPDGGIDFNQKAAPTYADFAYFGFTVGMTYQVSDTTITDPLIRRTTLQQALLSYFLGAVVLAVAINTVAGVIG